jgi:hypothetical protein
MNDLRKDSDGAEEKTAGESKDGCWNYSSPATTRQRTGHRLWLFLAQYITINQESLFH